MNGALADWEAKSKKIKTFRCEFMLWEYDLHFGKRDDDGNVIPIQRKGEIKYATPDKGLYQVTHAMNQAQDDWLEQPTEHWICDGKSIFQFNYEGKKLIEYTLPKELQGQAIQDGPLPFVFGAMPKKDQDVVTTSARFPRRKE